MKKEKRKAFQLFVFLVIMLLNISTVSAQKKTIPAHVSWGKELKKPARTYIDKVITANKQGLITLRQKSTIFQMSSPKIIIEKYDAKFKLRHAQDIDLKYKNKKLQFEELLNLGGTLHLFTSFNNKAKEKTYLFYQTLSKRFKPAKKPVKIAEIPTGSWMKEGFFSMEISKDSSKILVYGQLPYKRKESERFNLTILDKEMNKLWDKNIILPYNDEMFSIQNYDIDNEGKVYILGKVYKESRLQLFQKKTPDYHYVVLVYSPDKKKPIEYKIGIQDKFITDLAFKPGNDGNLVCAGFYSEKGSYSIKGTCFFNVDAKSKRAVNIHLKKFDFDFLTENLSERRKKRAKRAVESGDTRRSPELYRYSLDDLILRSDGGVVLIAEQYYIEQRQHGNGTQTYTTTYYNYNDIIVVNIKPNGKIEWATHIPKRQRTTGDFGRYSSYSKAIIKDKIYFIYNDSRRNFEEKKNRKKRKRIYYFDGKKSVVALAELKKDGSLTTWPLFSNRDIDIITRPTICRQTGSNKMIIYGELRKKYRFGEVYFGR